MNDIQKHPSVVVVGCVHGDERVGERVIRRFEDFKIRKGSLRTVLANEWAYRAGCRFIDADLNRSFPGCKDGNHEERLACELADDLSSADYVVDIHSTTTDTEGVAFIARIDRPVVELVKLLSPRRVVLVQPEFASRALIGHVRAGVSLEYGRDDDPVAQERIISSILSMLDTLEMTESERVKVGSSPEYYRIVGTIPKGVGFHAHRSVRNFRFVRMGDALASDGEAELKAERDFYPVLFGEEAYPDIFGFMAERFDPEF